MPEPSPTDAVIARGGHSAGVSEGFAYIPRSR
jgi:hypothetical protein